MNLYFKHWTPSQCDAELRGILGLRAYKHAEKKKYHAWTFSLIYPKGGMLELCFTTNHKAYKKIWGLDWKDLKDWQLIGD